MEIGKKIRKNKNKNVKTTTIKSFFLLLLKNTVNEEKELKRSTESYFFFPNLISFLKYKIKKRALGMISSTKIIKTN